MATAANWRDRLRQIEAPARASASRPSAKTAITAKSPSGSDVEARFGTFGTFGTPSGNATGSNDGDGCGSASTAANATGTHDTGMLVSESLDMVLPSPADTAASPLPIFPSRDDFEERAALIEYGAGVPREWAEGFARLDLGKPPTGFDHTRWRTLVDDAGKFLDRWGGEAAALGWSTLDVFGVHPVAPGARCDAMGLVVLIDGGDVIAIDARSASIRTNLSGATLVYLRTLREGAVALWKLVC